MEALGFDKVLLDEFGNAVGVVFGKESGPNLLLNCHLDTVGIQGADENLGEVRDGKLYGRGAADCKAGLAAQMMAASLLKQSMLPLRGNLIVAATVAEENGCSVGVRGLLEKTLPGLGLRPDYVVLGEPTGLGIFYGHDGWVTLDVTVEGQNPFQVRDTAQAIYQDLNRGPRTISQGGNRLERLLVHQPDFADEDGFGNANITLDRHLKAAEDVNEVLGQVEHNVSLVAQACGAAAVAVKVKEEKQTLYTGMTTVVRKVTKAWQTDPFHPFIERSRQALAAAGLEAKPGKWELDRLGMGTAGSVLTQEFKLPVIGYGPGTVEMAHAAGECVQLDKMYEAVYGTTALAHSLIGVPVFGWSAEEI